MHFVILGSAPLQACSSGPYCTMLRVAKSNMTQTKVYISLFLRFNITKHFIAFGRKHSIALMFRCCVMYGNMNTYILIMSRFQTWKNGWQGLRTSSFSVRNQVRFPSSYIPEISYRSRIGSCVSVYVCFRTTFHLVCEPLWCWGKSLEHVHDMYPYMSTCSHMLMYK
jgi:hypothetical protein